MRHAPDALDISAAWVCGTCTDVGAAARVHMARAAVHATAASATSKAVDVSPTGGALLWRGNGALPAVHTGCQFRQ